MNIDPILAPTLKFFLSKRKKTNSLYVHFSEKKEQYCHMA